MKRILVGNRISGKCERSLIDMGYIVTKLPDFSLLAPEVSFHADMLIFRGEERFVTHKTYYEENKNMFDSLGIKITLSDEYISDKYPNDILFNAVMTKEGTLFANSKFASKYIKEAAKKIIDVKQGYAACSTCRVGEKAFITTDSGLHKAYTENGIDSVFVEKTGIELKGYDCGFIGGATVVLPEAVCFFGKAEDYSDYKAVLKFARKYGKNVISLSDEKLTDIGGAVVFE